MRMGFVNYNGWNGAEYHTVAEYIHREPLTSVQFDEYQLSTQEEMLQMWATKSGLVKYTIYNKKGGIVREWQNQNIGI